MTNIEYRIKYRKDQRVRQISHRTAEKVVRDGTITEDSDQFSWPSVCFDDDPDVVMANPRLLIPLDLAREARIEELWRLLRNMATDPRIDAVSGIVVSRIRELEAEREW